jgi:hypothetical protein
MPVQDKSKDTNADTKKHTDAKKQEEDAEMKDAVKEETPEEKEARQRREAFQLILTGKYHVYDSVMIRLLIIFVVLYVRFDG